MMEKFVTMLAVIFSLAGCSVKEDRMVCPCRLSLDFSHIDTTLVKKLNILATIQGKQLFSGVVEAENFCDEFVRDVPHDALRINIWTGGEERMDPDMGFVIPYGCECPPLYMYSFLADTSGETFHEEVDIHKNHCRLTVQVTDREATPYSLTFKGNVDGYNLQGHPSSGDFSCVAYPGMEGDSHAVLPRQVDASLLLELDDGTSVIKTFALGEHIAMSGYDWEADDLEDITLILDYCQTAVKISIKEWDKEYIYDIIL